MDDVYGLSSDAFLLPSNYNKSAKRKMNEGNDTNIRDEAIHHVIVVGAGALGCEVLKLLVKLSYITHITIIDMDTIETSNLSRQYLYSESDVGQYKSAVAATFLQLVYPHIRFIPGMFILYDTHIFSVLISTIIVKMCLHNRFFRAVLADFLFTFKTTSIYHIRTILVTARIQDVPLDYIRKCHSIYLCLDNIQARLYINTVVSTVVPYIYPHPCNHAIIYGNTNNRTNACQQSCIWCHKSLHVWLNQPSSSLSPLMTSLMTATLPNQSVKDVVITPTLDISNTTHSNNTNPIWPIQYSFPLSLYQHYISSQQSTFIHDNIDYIQHIRHIYHYINDDNDNTSNILPTPSDHQINTAQRHPSERDDTPHPLLFQILPGTYATANVQQSDQVTSLTSRSIPSLYEGGTETWHGHNQYILPGQTHCLHCHNEEHDIMVPEGPTDGGSSQSGNDTISSLSSLPPQSYPLCTLAANPRQPEHCVIYARAVLWPYLETLYSDSSYKNNDTTITNSSSTISHITQRSDDGIYYRHDGFVYTLSSPFPSTSPQSSLSSSSQNIVNYSLPFDPGNHLHIEWIAYYSIQRAIMYNISPLPTTQFVSSVLSHIQPAVASTNAMISSLMVSNEVMRRYYYLNKLTSQQPNIQYEQQHSKDMQQDAHATPYDTFQYKQITLPYKSDTKGYGIQNLILSDIIPQSLSISSFILKQNKECITCQPPLYINIHHKSLFLPIYSFLLLLWYTIYDRQLYKRHHHDDDTNEPFSSSSSSSSSVHSSSFRLPALSAVYLDIYDCEISILRPIYTLSGQTILECPKLQISCDQSSSDQSHFFSSSSQLSRFDMIPKHLVIPALCVLRPQRTYRMISRGPVPADYNTATGHYRDGNKPPSYIHFKIANTVFE